MVESELSHLSMSIFNLDGKVVAERLTERREPRKKIEGSIKENNFSAKFRQHVALTRLRMWHTRASDIPAEWDEKI